MKEFLTLTLHSIVYAAIAYQIWVPLIVLVVTYWATNGLCLIHEIVDQTKR